MRFTGKTALVTGGNSGIGFAAAQLLIAEGARVVITGRDRAKLDNAVAELGENALGIAVDLDDPASIDSMFKQIQAAYGSLNIVFANAGISGPTPLGGTTAAAFEAILRTNLTAVFLTVQGALPLMDAGGSIVLNGSVMRELGVPGTAAYSATKAGVTGMAKVFASELVTRGIRVNTVIPGGTRTRVFRSLVSPRRKKWPKPPCSSPRMTLPEPRRRKSWLTVAQRGHRGVRRCSARGKEEAREPP
jgi:NAD(P)-dependent dehydrogenase (short-subunit alcohol dehydrogenase family)